MTTKPGEPMALSPGTRPPTIAVGAKASSMPREARKKRLADSRRALRNRRSDRGAGLTGAGAADVLAARA